MADLTRPHASNLLSLGTVTYEDVRVVITPEGPYHYSVVINDDDGDKTEHAVEYVAINATTVYLEDPIWFIDANVDVGVPVQRAGETAWIWP